MLRFYQTRRAYLTNAEYGYRDCDIEGLIDGIELVPTLGELQARRFEASGIKLAEASLPVNFEE